MINIYCATTDFDAQILRASEYKKGAEAYCPYCGARMHLSHSPLGTPFMALYMGEVHCSSFCKKMEASETKICLEKTSIHQLIVDLLRIPKNNGWVRQRNYRDNGRNAMPNGRNARNCGRDLNETPKVSLKDLADLQVHRFGASFLFGGLPLGREMLSYLWAAEVDDVFEKYQGPKILHVLFNGVSEKNLDLWFAVRYKDQSANVIRIPVKLHFFDSEEYYQTLNSFFNQTTLKDGTMRWVAKNNLQEFYVCGIFDKYFIKKDNTFIFSSIARSHRQFAVLQRKSPET